MSVFVRRLRRFLDFPLLERTDYPGMEIRPIIDLDRFPEQCKVFFDNVQVPKSGRVGAENDGWSVAKHLLKHERSGSAASPALLHSIAQIRDAVKTTLSPLGRAGGQSGVPA